MEKMQKHNKMKRLCDKVVKGEIFTLQEEVEKQGRNTYLHRLSEKNTMVCTLQDPYTFHR